MKTTLTRPALAAVVAGGVAAAACGSRALAAKTLVIKGSDTMVNLSQAWAEAYMKKTPGAQISVTGGGSGVGIAAFLNGSAEIANASREMNQGEIDKAKQRGNIPVATTCAWDGLAIAVSSGNSLSKISIPELAKIFAGGADSWTDVGGKGGKIVVLSRESSSGTYVYFKEHVLGNKNYRADALLMPSTKAIATETARNPNAIGYGGQAYFKDKPGIKVLPVSRKPGGEAVMPTDENVKSKKYPIARPLYMYTPGKPSGMAAEFIRFCLSPEGQKIVDQVGYTPIK
jgi:phosphate transport system substrate-binding protein